MRADLEDITVETDNLEWSPLSEGIAFKVLRLGHESGTWSVLFQCQPGSSFAPHIHLGAGEYFLIKGRMDYRVGTVSGGSYGYEPLGVFHEQTLFPEYTELYFTNHGPIAFVDKDKNILSVLDVRFFADAGARAAA